MKATKIPNDILAILSGATFEGNEMRLSGTLDRGVYQRLVKIIEAAGGKWNKKSASHVFDGIAADAIEPILMTGNIVRPSDMGQFDTPAEVARRLVAIAGIRDGDFVLEPSAGLGNIARVARDAGGVVRAVEIDPKRVDKLRDEGFPTKAADFLSIDPATAKTASGQLYRFDRVIMNPPFARQADIDHVRHAIGFLNPGGRLVSVMSSGVKFRADRKASAMREIISSMPNGEIIDLPQGSFKSAGTGVNTVIVSFDMPEE